ncbi:molybdopterin molybdotransferase MoeA [Granulicoccus phenolivorans]|uniref:molybdopterin molybdotransferase MoeA n=1 Tax=Granulicoccus phenolivorans TaxID=266854 RepID=UPI0003F4D3C2|nr:gephyrin-like molybdotransferase Glp [Granulicoccus phenolivorans]
MGLFGRKKKAAPAPEPVIEEPTLPPPPATNAGGFRDWAEQRDYLLGLIEQLPPFGLQLLDAWGLHLCEDIYADVDLPGFDQAAVPGYAVRVADLGSPSEAEPSVLAVTDELHAGSVIGEPLAPGTAMRVTAGAPIPAGADAVVPEGGTDSGTDDVAVRMPVEVGAYIVAKGSDISLGDKLLDNGHRIGPRTIGLLAGVGVDKVLARPRPRVVVMSTGAELVDPGRPLTARGETYDAASFLLAAAARAAGAQVFRVPLVSTDPAEVSQAISDQLVRADLLVIAGGLELGGGGLLEEVLPELGLSDFCDVAIGAGMPLGFARIGLEEVPLLVVPNHPVDTFVAFECFVRPALLTLRGVAPVVRESVQRPAKVLFTSEEGTTDFIRAEVDPADGTVEPVRDASPLATLERSNALVLVRPDQAAVAAGDDVEVWLLDEDE